ncbi:methyltransferase [Pseudomaricurvus sp. HS19]|uniref:methyltransferase n=1 Tax=Pseudomaricurvus sp. HS19 TaxID=2692626 RepID=UPI00136EB0E1|nr:methyltransferase [Pseudomaricurvus sp. HS19]MYM64558.1 methyltransferase [Pseudomaricurvus sp. HS19]
MNSNDDNLLQSPFGSRHLLRYPLPARAQQSLRAWDAADEYLLRWLHEQDLQACTPTLVLNDQFGALTCSLPCRPLWSQSDSWLAQHACQRNLQQLPDNGLEQPQLLDSLQWPTSPLQLVVIRLPKQLALLEHQLYCLRPLLAATTRVVAAGMVKHWPASAQQLFEQILGPSHTSLAWKKARLLHCTPQVSGSQGQGWPGQSPYPDHYQLPQPPLRLGNHANLFSRSGPDIGSRFFLQHLPRPDAGAEVIDLGCGNGILGLAMLQANPQLHMHFVDESHMAVASARDNLAHNLPAVTDAHWHVDDGLRSFADNSADLVVNNPPFHQQAVVGDHLARQMFRDAHRVLRPGGELWVVANRHLGYHLRLQTLFGNCTTVAGNSKFVILRAAKA